jgi:hypothetical protein
MQVTGVSSLLILVALIPCIVVPLGALVYLVIKERRK